MRYLLVIALISLAFCVDFTTHSTKVPFQEYLSRFIVRLTKTFLLHFKLNSFVLLNFNQRPKSDRNAYTYVKIVCVDYIVTPGYGLNLQKATKLTNKILIERNTQCLHLQATFWHTKMYV